jgi:hypothetical protein
MEEWRWVLGYEGKYEVSSLGRVKAVSREWQQKAKSGKLYKYSKAERMLRPGKMPGGHLSVSLGRKNSRTVHSLVMQAFVGFPPANMEILHINGDPSDNRLDNLRYGTRSENILDAVKHGTWMSEARLAHCRKLRTYRKDYAPPFGSGN